MKTLRGKIVCAAPKGINGFWVTLAWNWAQFVYSGLQLSKCVFRRSYNLETTEHPVKLCLPKLYVPNGLSLTLVMHQFPGLPDLK